jgi:hypothetical protein
MKERHRVSHGRNPVKHGFFREGPHEESPIWIKFDLGFCLAGDCGYDRIPGYVAAPQVAVFIEPDNRT